jgi:anthranilate synthase component 1
MYFFNFGSFNMIGASPEPLVKINGSRVLTCPIAGTRKRGTNAAEEARLVEDLLNDEKEIAEHNMLVDLARNDLGRVCEYGSVKVKEYMNVEKYSHVMHLVSRVEGELNGNSTIYDALRSVFPAGTLSGAPKIKAMQIISELEPDRRGPYGGAVGYFGYDGNLDSCITIRTAIVKDGKVYVQAGAGIVYDSVPENEYQETLNKAAALFKAVKLIK